MKNGCHLEISGGLWAFIFSFHLIYSNYSQKNTRVSIWKFELRAKMSFFFHNIMAAILKLAAILPQFDMFLCQFKFHKAIAILLPIYVA